MESVSITRTTFFNHIVFTRRITCTDWKPYEYVFESEFSNTETEVEPTNKEDILEKL